MKVIKAPVDFKDRMNSGERRVAPHLKPCSYRDQLGTAGEPQGLGVDQMGHRCHFPGIQVAAGCAFGGLDEKKISNTAEVTRRSHAFLSQPRLQATDKPKRLGGNERTR